MAKLNNTMIQRAAESQNTQFADTRCVATVKEVLDAVMQIDCDQEAEDYLYSSLISRLHTVNDNLNHLGVHHWIKR